MSTPDEITSMLEDCERRSEKLSDWELKFIDDIGVQLGRGRTLTTQQDEKLTEIWERVTV